MNELVSVIIPVYNVENYLERCVDSIINQTYANIEVLLVNDGSTDDSGRLCDQLKLKDSRIKVFHKKNGGVASARNYGLARMTGDFFCFLDSDDAYNVNILENVINTFNKIETDVVVFGYALLEQNQEVKKVVFEHEIVDDITDAVKQLLTNYNAFGGGYPNKVWKRECFGGNTPLFDESLYYFEDMEWMTRAFLKLNKMVCIQDVGYLYCLRNDSVTLLAEGAAKRELGYHCAMKQVLEDLKMVPSVYRWFYGKYTPEVVNGIIDATLNRRKSLRQYLQGRMKEEFFGILKDHNISCKIKIRCLLIDTLINIHVL